MYVYCMWSCGPNLRKPHLGCTIIILNNALFGQFAQKDNEIWYPGRQVDVRLRYQIYLASFTKWLNREGIKTI